jgi:hypothetical protein
MLSRACYSRRVVQGELELLQLHVNTHPDRPIPIFVLMSGRVLSGELVARRLYHKALSTLPEPAQLISIDSRSDGHIYLLSPTTQRILKIDLQAVQGFGPATEIGTPTPVPAPAPTGPTPTTTKPPAPATTTPPKKPAV